MQVTPKQTNIFLHDDEDDDFNDDDLFNDDDDCDDDNDNDDDNEQRKEVGFGIRTQLRCDDNAADDGDQQRKDRGGLGHQNTMTM